MWYKAQNKFRKFRWRHCKIHWICWVTLLCCGWFPRISSPHHWSHLRSSKIKKKRRWDDTFKYMIDHRESVTEIRKNDPLQPIGRQGSNAWGECLSCCIWTGLRAHKMEHQYQNLSGWTRIRKITYIILRQTYNHVPLFNIFWLEAVAGKSKWNFPVFEPMLQACARIGGLVAALKKIGIEHLFRNLPESSVRSSPVLVTYRSWASFRHTSC